MKTDSRLSIAIASVIVSMGLIAVGNGLMFAYIPVRLGAEGYDPVWAGLIVTGLSAGGLAGCILTAPLVRRVGHARGFMVLSALIALSNASVGAGTFPSFGSLRARSTASPSAGCSSWRRAGSTTSSPTACAAG